MQEGALPPSASYKKIEFYYSLHWQDWYLPLGRPRRSPRAVCSGSAKQQTRASQNANVGPTRADGFLGIFLRSSATVRPNRRAMPSLYKFQYPRTFLDDDLWGRGWRRQGGGYLPERLATHSSSVGSRHGDRLRRSRPPQ